MISKVLETNLKVLEAILKVLKSISKLLKSIFKVLKFEITKIPSVPFVSQVIYRARASRARSKRANVLKNARTLIKQY